MRPRGPIPAAVAGMLAFMFATGCAPREGPVVATPAAERDVSPGRLACRLASYGEYMDAAWTHLPSLGVRYVLINVPPAGEVEATRKRLAEHGLAALVLRGEADFTQDSAPDALAGQLAVCRQMGVSHLFLSVKGHWPDKQVVYERLRRAGDKARSYSVILALETHPELGTHADVQLETMRGVDHPNVRVNFDTGNITYYNRGRDAAGELRKIIDYVATVEIKDHSGQFETWDFPPLGRGKVDITEVVSILKANKYQGPVTIEVEGTKGVTWSKDQTLKAIEESVSYLRGLGGF